MGGLDLPRFDRLRRCYQGLRTPLFRYSFTSKHVSRHERLEVELAIVWLVLLSLYVSVDVCIVLCVLGSLDIQRLYMLELLLADFRGHGDPVYIIYGDRVSLSVHQLDCAL